MGNRAATSESGGQLWLVAVGGIVVLVMLSILAGTPPTAALPFFVVGVLFFVALTGAYGLLGWHLLLRPLPMGYRTAVGSPLPVGYRQVLASLTTISSLVITVGAFWDEVWHRQYGIPFGEDLLWRPHLLMYVGFGLVLALGVAGLLYLLRAGHGTLQQRFRRDRLVGLMVLAGGFLLYALPADPLWHLIYGEDISAWSLPHLILAGSIAFILLQAQAFQLSTMRRERWTVAWRLAPTDLLVLLLTLAFLLMTALQVLTTEWDATTPFVIDHRPAWLLPAIIVGVAVGVGTLANHSARAVGMATLTGLVALAIRVGLIQLFGFTAISADAWLSVLPMLVTLDLGYAACYAARRAPLGWLGAAFAAMSGALVSFPLIGYLFTSSRLDLALGPILFLIGTIAALGASYAGQTVGALLAQGGAAVASAPTSASLRWAPPVAMGAVLLFIVLFFVTAAPPV